MSNKISYEMLCSLKWEVSHCAANSEMVVHERYGKGHWCLIRDHPTHRQPVLEFQPFWSAIEMRTNDMVFKLRDHFWSSSTQ